MSSLERKKAGRTRLPLRYLSDTQKQTLVNSLNRVVACQRAYKQLGTATAEKRLVAALRFHTEFLDSLPEVFWS